MALFMGTSPVVFAFIDYSDTGAVKSVTSVYDDSTAFPEPIASS
jgi:hypothetical protein